MRLRLPIRQMTNAVLLAAFGAAPGVAADAEVFVNSIGMRFVRIPAGNFQMGQPRGAGWDKVQPLDRASIEAWMAAATHWDWDEVPVHAVKITRPFAMG